MAAAERILTPRELNRALLARQLLLERGRMTLPRALERIGGLQAQYAPSMYIGLWTRLEGFARDDLTRALERRSVVQGTLMRTTIHLVSAADYWPFALATRSARRESWLRSTTDGLSARELAGAARRLRPRLAGGPLRRADVEALLGKDRARGVGGWIDLVRAPPSGTWERRRADLWALAEDWLGPPETIAREGVELLVRRYLRAFGPASRHDVADWTGLPVSVVAPVVARVAPRRFRTRDGTQLVDLPRMPLPDAETAAPVRYLPWWDATLLVHARRAGILPEEHRPRIFSVRRPQSHPVFVVDGTVAGTWAFADGRIRLEPFDRLDAGARRALEEEGERLATFCG
jgi:hypothetical protein